MTLEKIVQDFLIIWTTVDPIGTLAIFTALTVGVEAQARRRIALRATLYAFFVLLAAIVLGQVILAGMGIQLISLQVAGGVILFLFGLKMIYGNAEDEVSKLTESGRDISVFPLAIPSIATPGALMAVIVLTDNHLYGIVQQGLTVAVTASILFITYLLMLCSEPILRIIGKNGATILVKVMGMLLAALSVELIMDAVGAEQWLYAK